MPNKLPAKHPLVDLEPNDSLSEATAQSQAEDGLDKALVALDKAKNRVRSTYGRRIVSMARTDVIRLQKLLRRWEKYLGDAL